MLNNQAVSVYGDKIDVVQYQGIAFHNFFFFVIFLTNQVFVLSSAQKVGVYILALKIMIDIFDLQCQCIRMNKKMCGTPVLHIANGNCFAVLRRLGFRKTAVGTLCLCAVSLHHIFLCP